MRTFIIILAFCVFFTNSGLSQIVGNYESDETTIYEWSYSADEFVELYSEEVASAVFFENNRVGLSIDGGLVDYVQWSYNRYDDSRKLDVYTGTSPSGKELLFYVDYEESQLLVYSNYEDEQWSDCWVIKNCCKLSTKLDVFSKTWA